MLEGKRTKLFWAGLIIWAVASLYSFSILWTLFFIFDASLGFMASYYFPGLAIGLTFIAAGALIIKFGIKKELPP
jgi:hypothetical protein